MATFNIYVPSYKRSDRILTANVLEYCTYVVRESEKDRYEAAGVDVLAVPDSEIDSIAKVQNWIIENTPEDVVAIVDDDVAHFSYRIEAVDEIPDREGATREIERLAQITVDLDIALMGSCITAVPYGYTREFNFSGMIGPIRMYNRKFIKARYVPMPFFTDTDFALQELMLNRIILRPNYFVTDAKIETNSGGMNARRTKQIQVDTFDTVMKPKWGSYVSFNPKKNVTSINVKRQ